jgi:hypothetical protein
VGTSNEPYRSGCPPPLQVECSRYESARCWHFSERTCRTRSWRGLFSTKTAGYHLSSILSKPHVRSRTEAAAIDQTCRPPVAGIRLPSARESCPGQAPARYPEGRKTCTVVTGVIAADLADQREAGTRSGAEFKARIAVRSSLFRNRRNRNALSTTVTLDPAIAAAAHIGVRTPKTASGIITTL